MSTSQRKSGVFANSASLRTVMFFPANRAGSSPASLEVAMRMVFPALRSIKKWISSFLRGRLHGWIRWFWRLIGVDDIKSPWIHKPHT